jgi:murein DD-endopeptidase MepM/ murein hydrolase activator NlpD
LLGLLFVSLSACDDFVRHQANDSGQRDGSRLAPAEMAALPRIRLDGASPEEGSPPEGSCGEGARPTVFTWPVPAVTSVCQKFKNPITYQECGFHTGIDVCGAEGLDLVAIADAKVVWVGPLWLEGEKVGRGPYSVVLQHSPTFYSTYGHNRAASVVAGDCVKRGQKVGELGNLGYSSGPHLHFEILEGGPFTGNWEKPFENACSLYKDPLDYVKP